MGAMSRHDANARAAPRRGDGAQALRVASHGTDATLDALHKVGQRGGHC